VKNTSTVCLFRSPSLATCSVLGEYFFSLLPDDLINSCKLIRVGLYPASTIGLYQTRNLLDMGGI